METNEKGKNKKQKLKISRILVVAFVLLYVPSFIHWVFGRTTATGIIQMGKLEDSINTRGVLVRSEYLLNSPYDGICIPNYVEGDKIPANASVATVVNGTSQKLMEELEENDLRLMKTEQENEFNVSLFSGDVEKLNSEIKQMLMTIIDDGNKNSLSNTYTLKRNIDSLIQKKNAIESGAGNAEAYIDSLKQEKEILQGKLQENTKDVISEYSGIISYTIDGYESLLKPESLAEYTPDYIESIKDLTEKNNSGIMQVEENKPLAKVLTDLHEYIMVVLDKEDISEYEQGDSVDVRLNTIGKVVDGEVAYISPEIDGKFTLAIKVEQAISETAGVRILNIDLIRRNYEGYKVPLSCLRNIDTVNMKAEIVIVKANYAYVREVKIIAADEEYAILDTEESKVSLYDTYVQRPENIEEGQYINHE